MWSSRRFKPQSIGFCGVSQECLIEFCLCVSFVCEGLLSLNYHCISFVPAEKIDTHTHTKISNLCTWGSFNQKRMTHAHTQKRYKLDSNMSGISNFSIHITFITFGWQKIGSKSIKNYIRIEESKTEHIW